MWTCFMAPNNYWLPISLKKIEIDDVCLSLFTGNSHTWQLAGKYIAAALQQ